MGRPAPCAPRPVRPRRAPLPPHLDGVSDRRSLSTANRFWRFESDNHRTGAWIGHSPLLGPVPGANPCARSLGQAPPCPVERRIRAMLFAVERMSQTSRPAAIADRLAAHPGVVISDARAARRWTVRNLADRSGLAPSSLHASEHARPAGLQTYAAIASAWSLDIRLDLIDSRRRSSNARAEDPVHAAMGELIAGRLSGHAFSVAIDEPDQHFQFGGRADVLAWDVERRALLHVENRSRFRMCRTRSVATTAIGDT